MSEKKFAIFEAETGIIQEVDFVWEEGLINQISSLNRCDESSERSGDEKFFVLDKGRMFHFDLNGNSITKSEIYNDPVEGLSRIGDSNYFIAVQFQSDNISI